MSQLPWTLKWCKPSRPHQVHSQKDRAFQAVREMERAQPHNGMLNWYLKQQLGNSGIHFIAILSLIKVSETKTIQLQLGRTKN